MFFGQAVMAPAAVATLLAGIAMVPIAHLEFALWLAWGLVGVFASILLGAAVLGRASRQIGELLASAHPEESRLAALRRRLAVGGVLNVTLLLSTVWAMVFKPTL